MVTQHLPAQIFLLVAGLIAVGITALLPSIMTLIIGIGLLLFAIAWFFIELSSGGDRER